MLAESFFIPSEKGKKASEAATQFINFSGEKFKALDNNEYKLEDSMCVISDSVGVLGLGGIIGGTRSGTELDTKNVLIESAYFNPKSIRKTSKQLNIDELT